MIKQMDMPSTKTNKAIAFNLWFLKTIKVIQAQLEMANFLSKVPFPLNYLYSTVKVKYTNDDRFKGLFKDGRACGYGELKYQQITNA
jgi:hypothetical protein